MMCKFIVHKLFYKFTHFLLWLRHVENPSHVLLGIAIVIFKRNFFTNSLTRFQWLKTLRVNNEHAGELFWQLFDVKVLFCNILVAAVEDIKHAVVVSQSGLVFRHVLFHEHLGPADEQNRFLGVFAVLELFSEFLHVCVEYEFHIKGALEALVEIRLRELFSVQILRLL